MAKTTAQCGLLVAWVAAALLGGCDDSEKQKALAEAAQAKVELVKLRAEVVGLKGEISYLKEKLQTANQARDKLQQQLDQLLEERDIVVTEADSAQEQSDKLATTLAEQTKKAGELDKQVELLKGVIRELQTRIEPNTTPEQPKETTQMQTAE